MITFLTVDTIIGNQAFSHNRCNIIPGLNYNKQNNTFLKSLRKNEVEAQVEFTLKVMERARVTYYWCISSEKEFVGLCVLRFFGILASRCGSVVVRERDKDTKGPGSTLRCNFLSF